MRVLMISNPNSTSQNDRLFRRVVPLLRQVDGLHLVSRFTHRPGHAEEMCRGLTRDDVDLVLAVGGDGTVNEVVNGLLGTVGGDRPDPRAVPAVAVIPTGSANVFARALGFPPDPVAATESLVDLLRRDLRRLICLGTWNDRWFAVNAGFGIDADVIADVDRTRDQGFAATPLRYLQVGVRAWYRAGRRPPHIDVDAVSAGGERIELTGVPLLLASNTNPWTFLGPLPVVTNPRNSFDQGLGLFGLTDIRGVRGAASVLHLVGFGHERFPASWINRRIVQFDDASSVTLSCPRPQQFQADGEFEGEMRRVHLASIPDALEVFAPEEAYPARHRNWGQILRDLVRIY
ncbi:diacylglycerol/lipid kinase family protein [Corynebacterium halotolerans]|uniref:diacylglycerol/lipid kinase family protein n=1 Tax=Corynebacterium halotolerans TaxID=225326 RepID=UPI00047E3758|nr:diacylglycerol kinase family protein [Corynebacterium halotolerans]